MKTIEYLELINRIGFEQALKVDFKGYENRKESLYIFWDAKRGILLRFDTYADDINSGHFYYNWIPKDGETYYNYISSGGFRKFDDKFIWIGDHDCRNNIDVNIKNLKENGKFVVPWMERPFLWLLHYKDKEKCSNNTIDKDYYKLINEARILRLSKEIQIAIKGKDEKV